MFKELVIAKVIHNYPEEHLDDWQGDLSYQNYEAKLELRDYEHRLGEIKNVVMNYCVLPLGSREVHAVAPLVRSAYFFYFPIFLVVFLFFAIFVSKFLPQNCCVKIYPNICLKICPKICQNICLKICHNCCLKVCHDFCLKVFKSFRLKKCHNFRLENCQSFCLKNCQIFGSKIIKIFVSKFVKIFQIFFQNSSKFLAQNL